MTTLNKLTQSTAYTTTFFLEKPLKYNFRLRKVSPGWNKLQQIFALRQKDIRQSLGDSLNCTLDNSRPCLHQCLFLPFKGTYFLIFNMFSTSEVQSHVSKPIFKALLCDQRNFLERLLPFTAQENIAFDEKKIVNNWRLFHLWFMLHSSTWWCTWKLNIGFPIWTILLFRERIIRGEARYFECLLSVLWWT